MSSRLRWAAILTTSAGILFFALLVAWIISVPPYLEDPDVRATWNQRLEFGLDGLNQVTAPPYTQVVGPAEVSGCGMDSGDLIQPWAGRAWKLLGPARARALRGTTSEGRRAATQIANDLVTQGWEGRVSLDKRQAIHLWADRSGHRIDLWIQVYNDVIVASVDAPGVPAKVCKLTWKGRWV